MGNRGTLLVYFDTRPVQEQLIVHNRLAAVRETDIRRSILDSTVGPSMYDSL